MSKNIIFFFSGTGNSLKVAKDISASLEACEMVSMGNDHKLVGTYERIGFVFPNYGMGLPRRVREFIAQLDLSENKSSYLFTVATCGGQPGNTLASVDKLLKEKGAFLQYGNFVKMCSNYVMLYAMANNVQQRTDDANKVIKIIVDEITRKNIRQNFKESAVLNLAHAIFMSSLANKDKGFNVSDSCDSCRKCMNVCPVNNISMKDKKPVFAHQCEQCMACIQWCPNQAINYKNKTQTRGRYHHPEINYAEMVKK